VIVSVKCCEKKDTSEMFLHSTAHGRPKAIHLRTGIVLTESMVLRWVASRSAIVLLAAPHV
jgi:hypothetical protein